MLLVALTCTDEDLDFYKNTLACSFENFYSVFGEDVFFIVICQSKIGLDCSLSRMHFDSDYFGKLCFFCVNYLSVSRARNEAIRYAKSHGFSNLVFHDASLFYTTSYLRWVKSHLGKGLLSGSYAFAERNESLEDDARSRKVKVKDFRDLYVWSYVFPLNVEFPYFDERFGPGDSSLFASGEDFLFLRRFFQLNPSMRCFIRCSSIGIFHPPRPSGYSKHLAYAKGQGKIHQVFLLEEKSLYAVWRCLLFFGNALIRLLFCKKNSGRIFLLRLSGFLDSRVKI